MLLWVAACGCSIQWHGATRPDYEGGRCAGVTHLTFRVVKDSPARIGHHPFVALAKA
jgi:hypothetical protein